MFPKISIVTPSFNQGEYLEETILSVIGQNYPNLEYIIIDGGSKDNSVEIIKKYEKYLTYWVSENDEGQSDAINKGFKIATGDIFGWLNSDDLYMPNVFNNIISLKPKSSDFLIFGEAIHFRANINSISSFGSNVYNSFSTNSLNLAESFIQPSTFWSKSVWIKYGPLKKNLFYTFDWDFFLTLFKYNVEFVYSNKIISLYRLHDKQKTQKFNFIRFNEIYKIIFDNNVDLAKVYKDLYYDKYIFNRKYFKLLKKILQLTHFNSADAFLIKLFIFSKYKYVSIEKIQRLLYLL